MKTIPLGPFAGLNNRLPDFALGATNDRPAFLKSAVNVDIDGSGSIRRRSAATLVQALSSPHSLHGDLLVRSSALYRVTLPAYSEALLKLLGSNDRMSYVDFNGDTYFSNGTDSGRIAADGNVYPLALPTPDAPAVDTISGALYAGSYQVAVSYCNATTGEEGGVSAATSHALSASGALRVTLPASVTGATHINVYVSTVNGSIPLWHGQATVGATTYDITAAATGREANERFEGPLPAGSLFWFNGRLCSFKDNCLYEGLPYRPGYYLPAEGRIPFPATISNVVPARDGCYVVSDKTFFIRGERLQSEQGMVLDVLPYGGVPGTVFTVPDKMLCGWFGANGIVLATPDGQAKSVMADNVDVGALPASGVSAVFVDRGYRRVVSCGYCLNLDNMAVTTYADYNFTSVSGRYGTLASGIYDLAGSGNVPYEIGLGKQNFGTEALKSMPAIYLGVDSEQPMQVRIKYPGGDYTYASRYAGNDLRTHRVDPGKGMRANWFDISIVSDDGYDFTLASVSFGAVASTRRI